jgi:hypothetical protein
VGAGVEVAIVAVGVELPPPLQAAMPNALTEAKAKTQMFSFTKHPHWPSKHEAVKNGQTP